MLESLWKENQPPSIFGAMTGKAMPKAVARLANETDNVHSHNRGRSNSAAKAKKEARWNDFWNK